MLWIRKFTISKETVTKTVTVFLAGAEGLEVASQTLLRCPKYGGVTPYFDRCAILASLHLPPAALGDEARHAVLERKARFQLSRVLKYSPPKIPHKNSTFRI
jgi:hypothetical protein